MSKTNKSFKKRIRVTRQGKFLKRKAGQDHFNAKEPRAKQLRQKRWGSFDIGKKKLRQFLPFN